MTDFVNILNPSPSSLPPPPPRSVSTDSETFRQWFDQVFRKLVQFSSANNLLKNQMNKHTVFTSGVSIFGQHVDTNVFQTPADQMTMYGGAKAETAPTVAINMRHHYKIGINFSAIDVDYYCMQFAEDGAGDGSGQLRPGGAMPGTFERGIVIGYGGAKHMIPIIPWA